MLVLWGATEPWLAAPASEPRSGSWATDDGDVEGLVIDVATKEQQASLLDGGRVNSWRSDDLQECQG